MIEIDNENLQKKKQFGFSSSKNKANFEAFWHYKVSILNLLFLKIVLT